MAYFKDLREHLKALEQHGKLLRIKREINKDTQLHPIMRLQFRGLPEEERKAFLFENVVDSRGHKYNIPVTCCTIAGSTEVYAISMMCKPEEIGRRWVEAQRNLIKPRLIANGPVHEEVHMGKTLLQHGGLDEFPIPISTPGFDSAPFITSPYWVTKDTETGIRNIGTYRAHVKSPTRTGIFIGSSNQDIDTHWNKCKERGIPLQTAVVIGAAPNIGHASVAKIAYGVDEYELAGGLAGEAVELVKCKTVDLEVPAHAEIVLEGELSTDEVELEAPFGEWSGYMGQREMMPYFTIKCITHRQNPIWQCFLSQFPPSESTKIREIGWSYSISSYLKDELGMKHVVDVAFPEAAGSLGLIVIRMKKPESSEIWPTLEAVANRFGWRCKIVVAVDEDINPSDPDAVNWAMSLRMQPHRDTRIVKHPAADTMDFSVEPLGGAVKRDPRFQDMPEGSTLLVDATLKWPYTPTSLPKKEFMQEAFRIWNEDGLPALKLKEPWWGYNLGYWSAEEDEQAMLAVKGQYYQTGEILAKRRRRI